MLWRVSVGWLAVLRLVVDGFCGVVVLWGGVLLWWWGV